MLDQKWIRSELDTLAKVLLKKDFKLDVSKVTKMEGKRKELQLQTEALQNERNTRSKMIGQGKAAGEDVSESLKEMKAVNEALEQKKEGLAAIQSQLTNYLMEIPNIPHESVPEGVDESENEEQF